MDHNNGRGSGSGSDGGSDGDSGSNSDTDHRNGARDNPSHDTDHGSDDNLASPTQGSHLCRTGPSGRPQRPAASQSKPRAGTRSSARLAMQLHSQPEPPDKADTNSSLDLAGRSLRRRHTRRRFGEDRSCNSISSSSSAISNQTLVGLASEPTSTQ